MAKKRGKLASRYAKALLRSLEEELGNSGGPSGKTPAQEVACTLLLFSKLWTEDMELRSCLLSPMFQKEERRQALLQASQSAGVSKSGQQFLSVLFERDRISALPEIVETFAEMADRAAGVVTVDISVATEVSAEETSEIEQALQLQIGGTPNFSWSVEPTLLGGIVVSYGGKVLDGSLQGRLSRMEKSLLS